MRSSSTGVWSNPDGPAASVGSSCTTAPDTGRAIAPTVPLEDSLPATRRPPGCLPGRSESARAEFRADPHVDREAAHRRNRWWDERDGDERDGDERVEDGRAGGARGRGGEAD